MTQRRIRKDLKQWKEDPLDCCQVFPDPNDYRRWDLHMYGAEDTPYKDGVFQCTVKFPADYPFKPPDIRFRTKIFHLNISYGGKICLAEILDEWNPQFMMRDVIRWIDEIMCDPIRANAIANDEIVLMYLENREQYDKRAREWTQKYAIPDRDVPDVQDGEDSEESKDEKKNDSDDDNDHDNNLVKENNPNDNNINNDFLENDHVQDDSKEQTEKEDKQDHNNDNKRKENKEKKQSDDQAT